MIVVRFLIYLIPAFACWYGGLGASQHFNPLSRRISMVWWTLGVTLLLIGASRAMEIDMDMTDWLRDKSKAEGWYERRHLVQFGALAVGALVMFIVTGSVLCVLGSYTQTLAGPVVATGFLFTMEAARLVSAHETDRLYAIHIGPLPLSWAIQCGAIAFILFGVWLSTGGEPPEPIQQKSQDN